MQEVNYIKHLFNNNDLFNVSCLRDNVESAVLIAICTSFDTVFFWCCIKKFEILKKFQASYIVTTICGITQSVIPCMF